MADQTLSSLVIGAIDELNHVLEMQELLRLGLSELDQPSEKTRLRLDLLLNSYLCQSECHFQELQLELERMRQMLGGNHG